jgi:glycosyltransferase involved in cell wall biosynthesis
MKINVLYFKYPLYSSGSYFQEFLEKLSESANSINLIAIHYPKGDLSKKANIRFFWVPYFHVRFFEDFFFMFSTLLKVIIVKDLRKVDLVNAVGPRGLLAGWYLKKFCRVSFVCTIEMFNEKGSFVNTLYYEFVRFLIKKAPVDKFICWSNYYWEIHLKNWGIPKEKVAIVPAGINIEAYNPAVDGGDIKKKYAPNSPLIVFAKPLYYPNTESAKILVKAIASLKTKITIKLLVGSGEGRKEIYNLAKQLGVEDLVEFMPPTLFPEIPKYIAAADLIVLPFTYAATTSRSLLEALSMGKPVITTNVGEIPNIIKNGKEAILVNPTFEDVARAIKLVINNPDLAISLSNHAVALVKKRYSLSTVVEKTVAVFESVKNGGENSERQQN